MDEHDLRILPVLDEARRCHGLVSLFKLSKFLFPGINRPFDSRRVLSSLSKLAETLGGKLLVAHEVEREEDLTLTIGAMGLESFADRLELYARDKLLVAVGDRWDIQNLAIRERVRAMLVTGGMSVEKKTLEAAEKNKVTLISCPHDTATTAALCRASIAVRHVVDENFETLRENSPLSKIKTAATASGYGAFPVLDSEGRTVGILYKTDLLKRIERRLILVDHNELSQAVQGAEQVEILEIIDHHRIGTLTTQQPILFLNEPVGSTSTIVADCFLRYGVDLPAPIAGLLLAGLVSDTLNLTSPTATPRDAEVLRKLQEISGVNARGFTEKLFASGSLLTLKPAPQAVTTDCKEYTEDGIRFSVAQIEEIGFEEFWRRKTELLEALEDYRRGKDYLFSALLVTDVNSQSSLLALTGEARLAELIDYPRIEQGVYELRNVVSRKKQLLPYLTHSLAQIKGLSNI
jgi:manganese-dependent inorganic pyrophosphatase